ncbi:Cu(+2)-transporting P-type ATPase [Komagataella phaffii CBS 7435]|uniref:P-type Cu(+) transporter n=2 Tax=Komagataella phaffii TaxID=460519 RepID=C4QZR7_KOMPG|nr:Cu(+2)-transporting P-type ATPase, required for export of copper from the cytosol into an extracytos [Komagataella phaffii GS115]AOA62054.1 GQ67_00163T0 [Komagataella phaffii]CAH2448761.1 Cu(+2)-transporting P-type ATPase [Komagataella phaffii CBS 7435]AOA67808.1 GQ68_01225T0 [Komagataella phaffii GS115]CAY68741.1 Cu(+2)-transporting P-type ATPase, required for export of copper from the cytosol into an extracytos [Komagataella phaffii GS115]CCA38848.1 Cu(+2)-transporting P-type ATPase [Koma
MFQTKVTITGMTCSACVNSITQNLQSLDSVEEVSVSLMTETGTIVHGDGISPKDIIEVIEDSGFDCELISSDPVLSEPEKASYQNETTVKLQVIGMTCTNCSDTVESMVSQLDGVLSAHVALVTEECVVRYLPRQVGIRKIVETIENCGFDVLLLNNTLVDKESQLNILAKVKEIQYWRLTFVQNLIFGVPVFFLGHIFPMITHKNVKLFNGLTLTDFIQLVLASYIQLWLARKFYTNAYNSLRHGTGNMDLLICLSTTIAYGYSIITLLHAILGANHTQPSVLFDTSAMLFIFISFGKFLENKAKSHSSTALSKLLALSPTSCLLIENFSSEKDIESTSLVTKEIVPELLQLNDMVLIHPGSRIPCDGTVVYGKSDVDESLLTGESLPVLKEEGAKVICGSVNNSGVLYVKVDKLSSDTELQQIVDLVKDAQMSKAPVQRFADSVSSIFVPTILSLSVLTFIVWFMVVKCRSFSSVPTFFKDGDHISIERVFKVAISVIVVACPCALGLAAPTAIMVGTGVGATNGILIKGGEVLENASSIECVLFDKTGTITTGLMQLSRYSLNPTVSNISESDLWHIIGRLESNSEHPVAKALSKISMEKSVESKPEITVSNVDIQVGAGIKADVTINGEVLKVSIGNEKICSTIQSNEEICGTHIYVLINEVLQGYVELSDMVKSDSAQVVSYLMSQGISVALVTGDNQATAEKVASKVGIFKSNVFANVSPSEKAGIVQEIRSEFGFKIAFVGDGINDAPALVDADIGIAIASGTDVAIEAADIVLLSNDSNSISGLISALSISRATFKKIKMNFFWAFIYNAFMLPIAMGVFLVPFGLYLHPMVASAAMAFSSVSVVLNSLLLKLWKKPDISSFKFSAPNTSNDLDINTDLETGSLIKRFQKSTPSKKYFNLLDKLKFWSSPTRKESYELLAQ